MENLSKYLTKSEITLFKLLPKNYKTTKKLVKKVFKNKVDLAGKPYIYHLIRVAEFFKEDNLLSSTALLHDILEDTEITEDELEELGYDNFVVDTVNILTKRPHEDYNDYIDRIISSNNIFAMMIKMSDLEDNMDLSRLSEITPKDKKRYKKYKTSYEKIFSSLYDEEKIKDIFNSTLD